MLRSKAKNSKYSTCCILLISLAAEETELGWKLVQDWWHWIQ